VGCVTPFVKLGGTPSRNVLIGAAINVWAHSDSGNTETISNVTASVYLYPQARSGFFLTGGLGFSNYYVNSSPSFDGTGWGFTAGAGYDIRVGRDVSLDRKSTRLNSSHQIISYPVPSSKQNTT